MAENMDKWPPKRGPISKIRSSDGCEGDAVPLAAERWYDFHEFGWHLGNVGYNLANFMRTLALPKEVEHWSMTSLREKLVKIGARVIKHSRYVTFQLAEVAVPRSLFQKILGLIDDLRRRPVPA